jgi:predicted acylesterase/phospholipase RssA
MQFDLVFEGGGAKGIAFVGALQALAAAGHTPGRVLGTSAGAITATALAAGYSVEETRAALLEQIGGKPVFTTFLGDPTGFTQQELESGAMRHLLEGIDVPVLPPAVEEHLDKLLVEAMARRPKLRNLLSFVERGGWYAADAFLDWLRRTLNTGQDHGKPRRYGNLTLAQFHEATGRELTLVAADVTDGRRLVLNHRTTPKLPVVFAARMSMSVPLLWQEVIWLRDWGDYRQRGLNKIAEHAIVDGGLLSNFPIELFLSSDPAVTSVMGEKPTQSMIGFIVDEALEVPGAPPAPGGPAPSGLGELATVRRLRRLADTATTAHDRATVDEFEHLVVRLPVKTYGTTEFDMTPERRDALISAGRNVTETYLRQRVRPSQPGLEALPNDTATFDSEMADRRARRILDD